MLFRSKVEGEYLIIVNDNSMPRLTINSTYRSVLSQDKGHDPKTRRFVESKLNAAAWLIRSIEQRRLTLYKVAQCLVNLQRDFLDYGIKRMMHYSIQGIRRSSTATRTISFRWRPAEAIRRPRN